MNARNPELNQRRLLRPSAEGDSYRSKCLLLIILLIVSSTLNLASATEGASGRPVAGTAVNPGAGVVPKGPQWIVNLGVQAVDGDIGANRDIPLAGRIVAEAHNRYSVETLTMMKVWDSGQRPWHLASSLTVPLMQTRVEVSAFSAPKQSAGLSDRTAGLYDIALTPVIAGYRLSTDEHISFSLRVWIPTGRYESGQLANLSQNVWTFIPTVSYTNFLPGGWEVSAVTTVNFSTRNNATNYTSAPLFTMDLLGTRKFDESLSAGVILGWVQQLGDDEGPLADRLGGFQGRELAVGPIVTYSTKISDLPLSASLRWLNTVSQHNRFDRNTVYLSLSVPVQ